MTVYNGQKFIYKSVKSILKQSFKNFELVIIDDCSKDKTIKKIKQIKDKRVNIIKLNRRHGRTQALNIGIKNCKSDIIAIQDADDISEINRLKFGYNFLKQNNSTALVFSDYWLINAKGKIIEKKISLQKINEKILFSELKYNNLIAHSSVLFNKKKILKKKVFRYNENFIYAQDYDLILKCLKKNSIKFLKKKLVKIRLHNNNMTNNIKNKKIIALENLSLLNYSQETFKLNLRELLFIYFNKFKNYYKLILIMMGI